jgi:hypothetical protein
MPLSKTDEYQVSYLMSNTIVRIRPDDNRDLRLIRHDAIQSLPAGVSDAVQQEFKAALSSWLAKRTRSLTAYRKKLAQRGRESQPPPKPPRLSYVHKDPTFCYIIQQFGSQTALAAALGVTQPCVSCWMTGGIPRKRRDHIEFKMNENVDWSSK